MELSQLRALTAVIDHGSFSAAASHLRVSRSTLRSRLASLEQSVGVDLLISNNAGTNATPAGMRFLHKARKLLMDADSLGASASNQVVEQDPFHVRVPTGAPVAVHLHAFRASMAAGLSPIRISFCDDPRLDTDPSADMYIHYGPP